MAWDDEKYKGSDLPSDEWNEHVDDQKNHSSRHESGGSDVISVAVDQITSFASNVTSSISGEDIEPSSVSAQSLHADEVNTVVHVSPDEGGDAIAEAAAPRTKIILEPDATYEVTAPIYLEDDMVIQGAGEESTIIKQADGANTDIIASPDPDNDLVMRVSIRDLSLDGNKANNTSGNGVYAAFFDSEIQNVHSYRCPDNGFWLAGTTGANNDDTDVMGSRAYKNDGDGIKCGGNKNSSPAIGSIQLYNNNLYQNGGWGITCRGVTYKVHENQLYTGNCIRLDRTSQSVVTDNTLNPGDGNIGILINSDNGVKADRNAINSNRVKGGHEVAIRFVANETIRNTRAVGNVISGDPSGSAVGKGIEGYGTAGFENVWLVGNSISDDAISDTYNQKIDVPSSVFVNQYEERTSLPSGGDYDEADAGLSIIDTSKSPPTMLQVLNNGSLEFVTPNTVTTGTVSVSAGSTAVVGTGKGPGVELDVSYGLDTDPNADVKVDYRLIWDDSNSRWNVEFEETTGVGSVDVRYTIREIR